MFIGVGAADVVRSTASITAVASIRGLIRYRSPSKRPSGSMAAKVRIVRSRPSRDLAMNLLKCLMSINRIGFANRVRTSPMIRTRHLQRMALRSCATATRARQRPFRSHSCYCHVAVTFMIIISVVGNVEHWIIPADAN